MVHDSVGLQEKWPERTPRAPRFQRAEEEHPGPYWIPYSDYSLPVNVVSYHFIFQGNFLVLFTHMKLTLNIQTFYLFAVTKSHLPIPRCSSYLLTPMENFTFISAIFHLVRFGSSYQSVKNLLSWFHNPAFSYPSKPCMSCRTNKASFYVFLEVTESTVQDVTIDLSIFSLSNDLAGVY